MWLKFALDLTCAFNCNWSGMWVGIRWVCRCAQKLIWTWRNSLVAIKGPTKCSQMEFEWTLIEWASGAHLGHFCINPVKSIWKRHHPDLSYNNYSHAWSINFLICIRVAQWQHHHQQEKNIKCSLKKTVCHYVDFLTFLGTIWLDAEIKHIIIIVIIYCSGIQKALCTTKLWSCSVKKLSEPGDNWGIWNKERIWWNRRK